uniref:Uncharacterized protein n=1 Tax=Arundo donax TaxID=35708 RepID=A0A0A8XVN3_ARUDO
MSEKRTCQIFSCLHRTAVVASHRRSRAGEVMSLTKLEQVHFFIVRRESNLCFF